MKYKEALEYVLNLPRCSFKRYGITGILALLKVLDNPQEKLKFIHVAGTNGKGSVSTFCASSLKEAGFKTGLYISPFVLDFKERIQINGEFIKEEEFASVVERLKPLVENLNREGIFLTGFDFVTAVSIEYFFEKQCSFVVFEVGMGGRLDSTNVVSCPEVSVITHIDYDHIVELGGKEKSLINIAKEKAGIIKKGSFCVFSRNQKEEVLKVLKDETKKKGASFIVPDEPEDVCCSFLENSFKYKGEIFRTSLFGFHQIENALTAIETLLRVGISLNHIKNGLEKAFIPARLEVINKNPLVVLEGAHNQSGILSLKENLKLFNTFFRVFVVSIIKTKDYKNMLKEIKGCFDVIIFTKIKDERGLEPDLLAYEAKKLNLNYIVKKDVLGAISKALELAKERNGVVFIFGSLYLASEIKVFNYLDGLV